MVLFRINKYVYQIYLRFGTKKKIDKACGSNFFWNNKFFSQSLENNFMCNEDCRNRFICNFVWLSKWQTYFFDISEMTVAKIAVILLSWSCEFVKTTKFAKRKMAKSLSLIMPNKHTDDKITPLSNYLTFMEMTGCKFWFSCLFVFCLCIFQFCLV